MKEKIKQLAGKYAAEFVANRRHLHTNPELSFQEYETQKFVAEQLQTLGLAPQAMANTGLVALLEGKNPSKKVVALRADMDALPILEANDVSYKSTNPGVMHACGHDVHTASLLGVARILTELKDEFEGTVKLVFQPGEELAPGGASMMIREGVLENPTPQGMIGQHVAPQIPVGKIGFREGMYMASTDEIYLTVKGKGGHGAAPELGVDPVLVASHLIVALQQIVSRNRPQNSPSVLSFGRVIANGATNVIPNEVKIDGTFRCMNEIWREEGLRRIQKLAEGLCESMGAECEVRIVRGYPYLENHPELTRRLRAEASEYMGEENIVDLDIWMAGEDFAFYSQVTDSCFYRLGTRNEERGIVSGVHTPTFDVDEHSLEIGAGLMSWLALQELAV
ncbi:M20 family metallopeptidase [Siphonobacter sp. SORGH_AS_0500]|uniref:M20 metallopeptidase family protein n=1 Tax=Siphonobacter sp. SORGH_AS_0500 TaxID=1864824 RepID=UPI000CC6F61A|nr:M20 family metallopeptidase [Siphonobacter sp. SORGH_AS_0500]MDR6196667.1 amidohydrolase [Siphonobacter sp. SORGH_AS_0500]PKK35406.1 N-acyl-L-amino acid amidohydrolase [Siphonobacter sp. SORGH_AS_0500]